MQGKLGKGGVELGERGIGNFCTAKVQLASREYNLI